MTAYKGLGTYGNAVGVVTPLDHKLSNAAMVVKQSGNLIRPGLFWGGNATIVTGKANMSYDVAAYSCATTRGATSGAVFGGNDGVLNVATTAAPGSNSRYDVIYHWHREYSIDGVDSNPVIGVIQGSPAASPTVPSLAAFPGAIEIGRVLVPAGVTATNTGTTITQTAPFTAMSGGLVAFRTKAELDLWTTATPNQRAFVIADGSEYVYVGSTWAQSGATNMQMDTTNSLVRTITQVGIGKILGNGTGALAEAVTFPVPFISTPVTTVTILGSRATGAFNPAALALTGGTPSSSAASTTGFTANILAASGTYSAANDYYYSWSATGAI